VSSCIAVSHYPKSQVDPLGSRVFSVSSLNISISRTWRAVDIRVGTYSSVPPTLLYFHLCFENLRFLAAFPSSRAQSWRIWRFWKRFWKAKVAVLFSHLRCISHGQRMSKTFFCLSFVVCTSTSTILYTLLRFHSFFIAMAKRKATDDPNPAELTGGRKNRKETSMLPDIIWGGNRPRACLEIAY